MHFLAIIFLWETALFYPEEWNDALEELIWNFNGRYITNHVFKPDVRERNGLWEFFTNPNTGLDFGASGVDLHLIHYNTIEGVCTFRHAGKNTAVIDDAVFQRLVSFAKFINVYDEDQVHVEIHRGRLLIKWDSVDISINVNAQVILRIYETLDRTCMYYMREIKCRKCWSSHKPQTCTLQICSYRWAWK